MAGRKADPNTRYRVYLHPNKKSNKNTVETYFYAAVQEPRKDRKAGKSPNTTSHIGKVDKNLKFTPNPKFRLLSKEEQKKYIFPEEWDISCLAYNDIDAKDEIISSINKLENNTKIKTQEDRLDDTSGVNLVTKNTQLDTKTIENIEKYTCLEEYYTKLYGSFWLIEEISKDIGLYNDLIKVFDNNYFIVNELLSLAIYPYISGKNYNRFAKWQNTHKTLIDYNLTSSAITKLSQKITDSHRMSLIRLRLNREPQNCNLGCDSTTRSAWGKCLADIHWGKNKDNDKLQNTLETIVYSYTTHQPIYYGSFAGNTADMSTIRTIISDLQAVGIKTKDISFITDRGYTSEENLASLAVAEMPFLMCAKVNCKRITELLLNLKYDADGLPIDMKYNKELGLYYTQLDIPTFTTKLSDGTEVNIEGLKANIFMNLPKRMEEISVIKDKISEELSVLEKAQSEKYIPDDISKYNALFDYFKILPLKDNNETIGITFSECSDKINKEKCRCGFFASFMYKMNKDCLEALEMYKERDEHEKCFDILKNQMCFSTQRNSSESGKNGRSFIAFIGLIATSKLRRVWKEYMRDKYSSTLDMLDEMETIRYSEYPNGSYHMTSFTMKQVEISRACGVEPPYECIPKVLKNNINHKK